MNPKLRKFLEQNGLRADASELEAWALYDELKERGIELAGVEPGQRSAAAGAVDGGGQQQQDPAPGAQPAAGRRSYTDDELEAMINTRTVAAVGAETQRRAAVQSLIDVAGVGAMDNGDFARSLLDNPEIDSGRASQLILTELQKRNKPLGIGAQVGREAPEKLREVVTHGLMMRSGIHVENPADGAREFRGRHLVEICRELLTMQGQNVRGLSNMEIAGRALVAGSTSDFPHIFSALVNRTLLNAYTEWPSTWRPMVAVTGAMDFKDLHAIKLSGSPDLMPLGENGEYQHAKFSDSKESYRVITKGRTVSLTRQMIINDDLRAFTRIPQLFGVAAKRMESDAVWSLVTANGVMSDGVALFHADHKNLGDGVLSSDGLSTGRTAMRKQVGLNGERIDVIPAFLLVPVVLELDADVLLRSASLPDATMSSGVHNPWAGKLTPIADPHLDAVSATAWYLMAHPNQVPTIEVAWLEGEEQPYVEEMVDFDSDALKVKVRHDFGAGVVDHVGCYKSTGQ